MRTNVLSIVFILFVNSLVAQNKADLKLNLEKNVTHRFKSSSEQSISQTINGVQQNTTVKTSSALSLKVVDVSPDFIIAELRFDTLVTSTNAMGVNNNYNSASEGDIKSANMSDVMSCILNRLSKNGIYAKMNYTGKVLEIVNSKMLSDIILKDTSSITGPMASTMKTQIKNMVSDDALKTMVETFTAFLPGKQVGNGDKWEITQTMNSGGMSLDIITNYTLNGKKENSASISAESNIKASQNAAPMQYGGAKITYGEITGLSKSNMVVDTRTGLLIESSGKSHISGNLNVTAQGMNMQIPMEIQVETNIVALP
jgi:hypothetical protein